MATKKVKADGSIGIRVDLRPPYSQYFLEMKEEKNFMSDAEAIRYCINETYNTKEFKLEDPFWRKIRHLLNYDYVKNNSNVYNVQSFINKALEEYFQRIESENESIMSFDVRGKLKEDELDIALAFIDVQETAYNNQVTVEKLMEKLGKRNSAPVVEILEDFVERGILSKIVHKSTIYYHAAHPKRY